MMTTRKVAETIRKAGIQVSTSRGYFVPSEAANVYSGASDPAIIVNHACGGLPELHDAKGYWAAEAEARRRDAELAQILFKAGIVMYTSCRFCKNINGETFVTRGNMLVDKEA